ncbi:MAG: carboxymuconolactone decarboxylase family protein [Kiritimatiellales bacterium]
MKIQTSETRELAAMAAAMAGKCQPCFAYHFKQAQQLGISDEQIQEVIQLAKDIRASGDKHMDEFAHRLLNETRKATT